MELYLYCTYAQSRSGYSLTKLSGDGLVPVTFSQLHQEAADFLNYDHCHLLWRTFCEPTQKPWHAPECTGSIFAIRDLQGCFSDGRSAVANFVFLAEPTESDAIWLRRTALAILGDVDSFCARLFSWLSAGGPCSYQIDGEAANSWIRSCGECDQCKLVLSREENPKDPALKLLPELLKREQPRWERDCLHLAACKYDWRQMAPVMGQSIQWALQPGAAMSIENFNRVFRSRGPLWRMTQKGAQAPEAEKEA